MNWVYKKLGQLVTFKTGKLDSNAATPNGKYPFFTCAQENFKTDAFAFDGEYVLLAGNNANGIFPLKYFHGKFNAYQRTYAIQSRDVNDLDNKFLYFLLRPKLDLLRSYSNGATTKFLTLTILNDIECCVPPISTQHKIASILSAYDDLIENNQRRIALLEEMSRNLYREWFVHFRFPGHERAAFRETELGRVPEGWEVVRTVDAIAINPTTKVPKEGFKPFVPMGSLSNDLMLISDVETREGNSGSKFKNGDTLFARITPCLENGKTAFVQFLPSSDAVAFGSTEFIVLRSRTLCPEYVYLLARSNEFRDNAIQSMSGATGRQRVQEECFNTYLFAHPDRITLEHFHSSVRPMFESIHVLSLKNANLRRTRDLLLPRLVSGEIDVSDLEIAGVEELEIAVGE